MITRAKEVVLGFKTLGAAEITILELQAAAWELTVELASTLRLPLSGHGRPRPYALRLL
jgi:hypothetical protein